MNWTLHYHQTLTVNKSYDPEKGKTVKKKSKYIINFHFSEKACCKIYQQKQNFYNYLDYMIRMHTTTMQKRMRD